MKDFKGKSLLKLLMNCQRNLSDTLNKSVFVKKLNKRKKNEDSAKLKRPAAEMLKKLSELVSNVFMKKS